MPEIQPWMFYSLLSFTIGHIVSSIYFAQKRSRKIDEIRAQIVDEIRAQIVKAAA